MTAEAHHYEELHRLVDRLEPDQAEAVRAVVLQLVGTSTTGRTRADSDQRRRFSFANSISAEPDFAERSEEILEEITGRTSE